MKDGCLKTPDVSISSWWKLKIELKETLEITAEFKTVFLKL